MGPWPSEPARSRRSSRTGRAAERSGYTAPTSRASCRATSHTGVSGCATGTSRAWRGACRWARRSPFGEPPDASAAGAEFVYVGRPGARTGVRNSADDSKPEITKVLVQDVSTVSGAVHPLPHDRAGGGVGARAPRQVLADRITLALVEVVRVEDPVEEVNACRRDVVEELLCHHQLGVRRGRVVQRRVAPQALEPSMAAL